MRRQVTRSSRSAAIRPFTGCLAAVFLTALGPLATARAVSLSEFLLTSPAAGAELLWGDFQLSAGAAPVPGSGSYQPDFGTAGLTVTGPFATADGQSGGMVFCWTAMARDPAFLVAATALFSMGDRSWIDGDESLRALPDLGVVPGGNLSVFDTGAVDVISWNFLEFDFALLALRLEDYIRLKKVLEPGDFDQEAQIPAMGEQLSAVPDPETSLLMGQGLLILALLGPQLSPRRPAGAPARSQGAESSRATLPGR